MKITFELKIWFDALWQGLLFHDLLPRVEELKEYVKNPYPFHGCVSIVIQDHADPDDGLWELEPFFSFEWMQAMVREWQRFVQGGVFCYWGEEESCWLFYATGQHVGLYIAPFELYERYHPASEPSWPIHIFAIDRDFQTLRRETTLQTCFVIELYDWVQGSLTIGRQYTTLLLAVQDGFERGEEDAAFYAEELDNFCAAFPHYEQQMDAWLYAHERSRTLYNDLGSDS